MPKPKVLFKFGTQAQYAALETKLDNALYFLTDTHQLYRGTVPIGESHVYTDNRAANVTDNAAILSALNSAVPVNGDVIVLNNVDGSSDAFIYQAGTQTWLHIGNTLADSLAPRITTLEGKVTNLESALGANGTGLQGRVSDLEAAMANVAGAFHFKGSTTNLDSITNPSNGDVYQVDSSEYAWNGTTWVELGTNIDLSHYVLDTDLNSALGGIRSDIRDLQTVIGSPKTYEEDEDTGELVEVPSTGIYQYFEQHASELVPLFDGYVSGLVPVATGLTTQQKASKFLNALGNWVEVETTGGQTTYRDPEGNIYNTVEAYVTYMIDNYAEQVWESIDSNS